MIETIISVLLISLSTYAILGGADLGVGIIELFDSKKNTKNKINLHKHALKTVWEINHIWLALPVIILFSIFPKAFFQIFTVFIIPILFIFIGLFSRAFSFTLKLDESFKSSKIVSKLFDVSSIWSTFWLGVLAGSLIQGQISSSPETIYQQYIQSWLSPFSLLVGFFLIALFAFNASIFLHAETDDKQLQNSLKKKAIYSNIMAIFIGFIILVYAFISKNGISFYFLQSTLSLISFVLATVCLFPLWLSLKKNKKFTIRALATTQMLSILIGLFGAQYPIIFQTNLDTEVKTYTFFNTLPDHASPALLIFILAIVLILIIPSYFYILKAYKLKLLNMYSPKD